MGRKISGGLLTQVSKNFIQVTEFNNTGSLKECAKFGRCTGKFSYAYL
jgi:hypothetical protein